MLNITAGDTQIKTTVRYHLKPVGTTIIKNSTRGLPGGPVAKNPCGFDPWSGN